MVTKLPAFTRPLVSTIGHVTRAEPTNEKQTNTRGGSVSSRDFKIKSIDGLKLTVKTDGRTDTLKRKNITGVGESPSEERKFRIDPLVKKVRVESESESDTRRNVQVS